jgi:hypothetical protein
LIDGKHPLRAVTLSALFGAVYLLEAIVSFVVCGLLEQKDRRQLEIRDVPKES